jgi:hypothetical protein
VLLVLEWYQVFDALSKKPAEEYHQQQVIQHEL